MNIKDLQVGDIYFDGKNKNVITEINDSGAVAEIYAGDEPTSNGESGVDIQAIKAEITAKLEAEYAAKIPPDSLTLAKLVLQEIDIPKLSAERLANIAKLLEVEYPAECDTNPKKTKVLLEFIAH